MKLAVIPARGGSRRVPRKNCRPFAGKPMLLHPIAAAKESNLFDLIVVSTDDVEIAAVAFGAGCAIVPRETDNGTTGTQEIAARVLERLDVQTGIACVIYPTSPLLMAQDLTAGHARLLCADAPPFTMSVGPDGQDAGCFYFGWVKAFRDRISLGGAAKVELPAERVCDVNVWSDWFEAERKYLALRRAA